MDVVFGNQESEKMVLSVSERTESKSSEYDPCFPSVKMISKSPIF